MSHEYEISSTINHDLDRVIDELLQWCGKTSKDKPELEKFAKEIRHDGYVDGYADGYANGCDNREDDEGGREVLAEAPQEARLRTRLDGD